MENDGALRDLMQKFGSKYEYKKYIGQGAFSRVYLLYHRHFKEEHALKIMDSGYILQTLRKGGIENTEQRFEELKKRFLNEAQLYRKIDNPNIVEIFDVDTIDDKNQKTEIVYITMRFIDGITLDKYLQDHSPLEVNRAVEISQDILTAVSALHENKIIHRDIKPANIMIEKGTNNILQFIIKS